MRQGTRAQIARFETLCDAIASVHPQKIVRHAANTACIFRYPQAHADMVRGGIALYGYPPVPEAAGLMPAMRWVTRGVFVKIIQPGDRVSYGGVFEAKRPTVVMTPSGRLCGWYRRGISERAVSLSRKACADYRTRVHGSDDGRCDGYPRRTDGRLGLFCSVVRAGTASTRTSCVVAGYHQLRGACSPSARVPRVYIHE